MTILTLSMRGGMRTLQATPAEWRRVHETLSGQELLRTRPNTALIEAVFAASRSRDPVATVTVSVTAAEHILRLNT